MSAIPIAYILGGPLAGMILVFIGWTLPDGDGSSCWKVCPRSCLESRHCSCCRIGLTKCDGLQPNERDWLSARLAEERRAKAHRRHVTIWQALRHPAVMMLTAGLFFCYTGGYAFWFWMPTMLQRLTGWTDVQRIGWIGAIPFVAGLIGMLLLGWNSDRTRERRWHFAVPQLTAALR